jgi:hypothetical protein
MREVGTAHPSALEFFVLFEELFAAFLVAEMFDQVVHILVTGSGRVIAATPPV